MADLQRITTEYIETEDRIRLSGEIAPNQTVVLWLTQRSATRLLTYLLDWMAQQAGHTLRPEIVLGFAQQAAIAALEPQVPVQSQPQSAAWLVHAVDIAPGELGLTLLFKGVGGEEANEPVTLMLQIEPLREWLNILQAQYQVAGWSMTVWPDWMQDAHRAARPPPVTALH